MAYCVQNGISFLGHKTQKSDVLYVDYELRENAIKKRYDALNEYLHAENAESYKVMSLSSDADTDLDTVIEAARAAKDSNSNIKLIIFDCYYSFAEGDQNSEADVKAVLKKLKSLTDMMTVVYVTHTNKNDMSTSTKAIYAAGGSGVHGKIVDETYTIAQKKDKFVITSTGRDWSDRQTVCRKDESTNWFFAVEQSDLDMSKKRNQLQSHSKGKQTLEEEYPELCKTIGNGTSLYML